MSFRNRFAAAAAAIAVSAMTYAVVASAKYKFAGDQGIQFLAQGPAGMKINGTSSDLKAEEADGTVKFTASLLNLNTDEPTGLRDKHTRKYLETDKYKDATLVVDSGKIKVPEDKKESEGDASGKFTLHGVTKDLNFHYKLKRTGSDLHARGSFKINIEDYKIEQPCYMKVCVQPVIDVKVKFKLRDK